MLSETGRSIFNSVTEEGRICVSGFSETGRFAPSAAIAANITIYPSGGAVAGGAAILIVPVRMSNTPSNAINSGGGLGYGEATCRLAIVFDERFGGVAGGKARTGYVSTAGSLVQMAVLPVPPLFSMVETTMNIVRTEV